MDKNKVDAQAVLEAITARSSGPKGSRLPKAVQEVVAEYLDAGGTIAGTARELGLTRDQVRTVKLARLGVTLAEVRRFKAELRVAGADIR